MNEGEADWSEYIWPIYPYSLRGAAEALEKAGPLPDCPPIEPDDNSGSGGGGTLEGPDHVITDPTYRIQLDTYVFHTPCDPGNSCPGTEMVGDAEDCPDPPSGGTGIIEPVDLIDFMVEEISNTLSINDSTFDDWLRGNPEQLSAIDNILRSSASTATKAEQLFDLSSALVNIVELKAAVAIIKKLRDDGILPYKDYNILEIVGHAAKIVLLDEVHTLLDIAGMVPALGEPADFANGVIYLLEGDKTNASISFAGMIPIGGQIATGGRLAFKVVKTATGRTTKLVLSKVNNIIEFCNSGIDCRGQIRKLFPSNSLKQVHHIIPWELRTNELIQKAAETGRFHMNQLANGFHLEKARHFNYDNQHINYNEMIKDYFDSLNTSGLSAQQALDIVNDAISSLDNQLKAGNQLSEISLP